MTGRAGGQCGQGREYTGRCCAPFPPGPARVVAGPSSRSRPRRPRSISLGGMPRFLLLPLAPLALAGCDLVRSFESTCAARLPPTEVRVATEPVAYRVDRSLDYQALTRKGAAIAGANQMVLGLTEANLAYSVEVTARGISSRSSGRYCMRPSVEVKLSFNPMTVYMGSNVPKDSCADRVTWEHEMKHVAVYQDFLPEFAKRVDGELRAQLGTHVQVFANADAGQKHLDDLVRDSLGPLVQGAMAEVKRLQREVDSPREYARIETVRAACGS